jgi:hypothetical protein
VSSLFNFQTLSKLNICQVTFETCVKAITFTFSSYFFSKSAKSKSKLSVIFTKSSSIHISSFKISQGTIFEWCSTIETKTLSPNFNTLLSLKV